MNDILKIAKSEGWNTLPKDSPEYRVYQLSLPQDKPEKVLEEPKKEAAPKKRKTKKKGK